MEPYTEEHFENAGYKKDIWRILLLISIFFIFILILFVSMSIVLKGNSKNAIKDMSLKNSEELSDVNEISDPNKSLPEISEENLYENKINVASLQDCLIEKSLSAECFAILENEHIEDTCNQMGDLKDNCYYEAAFVNNKEVFCNKISNKTLNEECKMDLILLNLEKEEI